MLPLMETTFPSPLGKQSHLLLVTGQIEPRLVHMDRANGSIEDLAIAADLTQDEVQPAPLMVQKKTLTAPVTLSQL